MITIYVILLIIVPTKLGLGIDFECDRGFDKMSVIALMYENAINSLGRYRELGENRRRSLCAGVLPKRFF
ncbi:MAG: hypothetical protein KME38_13095 [Spirirestis rafaelensis WJT71-NPBG6]|nr:hypothetical protein [Spirirestis rafaelensis WJT71-NPBG6]